MGRVVVWLLGGLVVLATTATGLNLINPKPLDPGSPLAPQTAAGNSRFTPAGEDYIEEHKELFLQLGPDSDPAVTLGLPPAGGHTIKLDPACDAHLRLPAGEMVLRDASSVEFFMVDGTVASVELTFTADEVSDAIGDAGFRPSELGVREEQGVRIGARLSNAQLHVTVRVVS